MFAYRKILGVPYSRVNVGGQQGKGMQDCVIWQRRIVSEPRAK